MIAALFVDPRGIYSRIPEVDLWPEARDARLYAGPWPVVAHPPCARWCRLAGLVEARFGHRRGEDGGCFEAALAAVRRWGGILEHPAWSKAWEEFNLPRPPAEGWQRGTCGLWVAQVEQGRYGHPARKATWLVASGPCPPTLRWGPVPDRVPCMVSWCRNRSNDLRPRVGKRAASATPEELAAVLVDYARTVIPRASGQTWAPALDGQRNTGAEVTPP